MPRCDAARPACHGPPAIVPIRCRSFFGAPLAGGYDTHLCFGARSARVEHGAALHPHCVAVPRPYRPRAHLRRLVRPESARPVPGPAELLGGGAALLLDRRSGHLGRGLRGRRQPGVTVAGDRVLLFYSGRGPADPAGPFQHSMNRADLPGQIMLATAPGDADGAPAGPFGEAERGDRLRRAVALDPARRPAASDRRRRDPAVLPGHRPSRHLRQPGDRAGAHADRPIDRPAGPYAIHPEPVLRSKCGCESPRLDRIGDEWHMFVLRYTARPSGLGCAATATTAVPIGVTGSWSTTPPTSPPATAPAWARPTCARWTPLEDAPPRLALANRIDDGTFGDPGLFKQSLWEIREVPASRATGPR